MKGLCVALLATLMLAGVTGQAAADLPAVQIFYDLQDLGYDSANSAERYQYTYTVQNSGLGAYTYIDPGYGLPHPGEASDGDAPAGMPQCAR